MIQDQIPFDSLKKSLDGLAGILECSQLLLQCQDELIEQYGKEALKKRIVSWKEALQERQKANPDKPPVDVAIDAARPLKQGGYDEGARWVFAAAVEILKDRLSQDERAAS